MKIEKKNQAFLEISKEIRDQLMLEIEKKDVQDVVSATKAATDTGTFEVIISTSDMDRHGEMIAQEGWDLENYRNNPVVLWAHDYKQLPVGVCDEVMLQDGKLVAKGRFAPTAFAQEVRQLYEAKMLFATSVGCMVYEAEGNTFTKQELLEFSFVPVPANPFALRLNEMGKDATALIAKGIFLAEEVQEKGALSDEVDRIENDEWNQKYDKLDEAYELFAIMADLYLYGGMKVDDFGSLITELGQMFVAMGSGAEVSDKLAEAKAKGITKEALTKASVVLLKRHIANKGAVEDVGATLSKMQADVDKTIVDAAQAILAIVGGDGGGEEKSKANDSGVVEKEGRVLSSKNRELIQTAIEPLKATTAALEALLSATDPEGDDPQKAQDGGEVKQRSKGTGSSEVDQLNSWYAQREVLRLVNNVTSKALEKYNKRRNS